MKLEHLQHVINQKYTSEDFERIFDDENAKEEEEDMIYESPSNKVGKTKNSMQTSLNSRHVGRLSHHSFGNGEESKEERLQQDEEQEEIEREQGPLPPQFHNLFEEISSEEERSTLTKRHRKGKKKRRAESEVRRHGASSSWAKNADDAYPHDERENYSAKLRTRSTPDGHTIKKDLQTNANLNSASPSKYYGSSTQSNEGKSDSKQAPSSVQPIFPHYPATSASNGQWIPIIPQNFLPPMYYDHPHMHNHLKASLPHLLCNTYANPEGNDITKCPNRESSENTECKYPSKEQKKNMEIQAEVDNLKRKLSESHKQQEDLAKKLDDTVQESRHWKKEMDDIKGCIYSTQADSPPKNSSSRQNSPKKSASSPPQYENLERLQYELYNMKKKYEAEAEKNLLLQNDMVVEVHNLETQYGNSRKEAEYLAIQLEKSKQENISMLAKFNNTIKTQYTEISELKAAKGENLRLVHEIDYWKQEHKNMLERLKDLSQENSRLREKHRQYCGRIEKELLQESSTLQPTKELVTKGSCQLSQNTGEFLEKKGSPLEDKVLERYCVRDSHREDAVDTLTKFLTNIEGTAAKKKENLRGEHFSTTPDYESANFSAPAYNFDHSSCLAYPEKGLNFPASPHYLTHSSTVGFSALPELGIAGVGEAGRAGNMLSAPPRLFPSCSTPYGQFEVDHLNEGYSKSRIVAPAGGVGGDTSTSFRSNELHMKIPIGQAAVRSGDGMDLCVNGVSATPPAPRALGAGGNLKYAGGSKAAIHNIGGSSRHPCSFAESNELENTYAAGSTGSNETNSAKKSFLSELRMKEMEVLNSGQSVCNKLTKPPNESVYLHQNHRLANLQGFAGAGAAVHPGSGGNAINELILPLSHSWEHEEFADPISKSNIPSSEHSDTKNELPPGGFRRVTGIHADIPQLQKSEQEQKKDGFLSQRTDYPMPLHSDKSPLTQVPSNPHQNLSNYSSSKEISRNVNSSYRADNRFEENNPSQSNLGPSVNKGFYSLRRLSNPTNLDSCCLSSSGAELKPNKSLFQPSLTPGNSLVASKAKGNNFDYGLRDPRYVGPTFTANSEDDFSAVSSSIFTTQHAEASNLNAYGSTTGSMTLPLPNSSFTLPSLRNSTLGLTSLPVSRSPSQLPPPPADRDIYFNKISGGWGFRPVEESLLSASSGPDALAFRSSHLHGGPFIRLCDSGKELSMNKGFERGYSTRSPQRLKKVNSASSKDESFLEHVGRLSSMPSLEALNTRFPELSKHI